MDLVSDFSDLDASLAVALERRENDCRIRLDGVVDLTSAGELKRLLLELLSCEADLQVDMERVEGIDIPAMQLLWAAGREADRSGRRLVSRVPLSRR